ncbi:hypothetical protein [Marinilactibacillus kalidii]|uniref:hypothetical protein n=1 Tax=Marinilactibacillus kalidii TaxID=2820274 RepID=UPI001ABD9E2A|nr:hypothetical protein [Marinilactibacillus kalidii]
MEEIISVVKTAFEIRGPWILIELIFLAVGILSIVTGVKIRKQSKRSAIISIVLGIAVILFVLYMLLWTIVFGYNS